MNFMIWLRCAAADMRVRIAVPSLFFSALVLFLHLQLHLFERIFMAVHLPTVWLNELPLFISLDIGASIAMLVVSRLGLTVFEQYQMMQEIHAVSPRIFTRKRLLRPSVYSEILALRLFRKDHGLTAS